MIYVVFVLSALALMVGLLVYATARSIERVGEGAEIRRQMRTFDHELASERSRPDP